MLGITVTYHCASGSVLVSSMLLLQRPITPGSLSESHVPEASTIGGADRNELFFKYKRNTEEGRRLAGAVKSKQQQLNQLKEDIKVKKLETGTSHTTHAC